MEEVQQDTSTKPRPQFCGIVVIANSAKGEISEGGIRIFILKWHRESVMIVKKETELDCASFILGYLTLTKCAALNFLETDTAFNISTDNLTELS